MADKIIDREGFTTTKAKPKPVVVAVPNYARYEGIEFCKPHGINIDYCSPCKTARDAKKKPAKAQAAEPPPSAAESPE
jgi:hypothetical protein